MPRGSGALLLPLNPFWLWSTLLVALGLVWIPLGRLPFLPDVLLVVLAFWTVHQPRRVGIFTAFLLGLCVDVSQGALMGQHALSYTLMSFVAVTVHRRLLWFPLWSQSVQMFPLFLGTHAVDFLVRMATGGMSPGWPTLLAPVGESLLWPVAYWVLLAPQRRPPDRDENRPL